MTTQTESIPARLAALKTMPMPDLEAEWRALFDTEPPPFNRRHLENRIAYRIQEIIHGGLEPETLRRLEALGEQFDSGHAPHPKRRPADRRHQADPRVEGHRVHRDGAGRPLRVGWPAVPLVVRHRPRDHRHPLERPHLKSQRT